jgi:UDP-2-acetamido-2,6-beta-L-arabino-hexul-4-ose reductase
MILGKGDIASVLNDREGAIYFASGVSNSQCSDEKEFERERELFMEIFLKYGHLGYCFFYFSTLSIYTKVSLYTLHKMRMENLVKASYPNYNIIRIGNITWGQNPNTFINYFKQCIQAGIPYAVRDEYKYLINEKELLTLTDHLPLAGKHEISVTGKIVKVQDVVNELLNDKREIYTDNL